MELKPFEDSHTALVSSWASTAQEVALLSGREEFPFPADLVDSWRKVADDITAYLYFDGQTPVGYGELWLDDEETRSNSPGSSSRRSCAARGSAPSSSGLCCSRRWRPGMRTYFSGSGLTTSRRSRPTCGWASSRSTNSSLPSGTNLSPSTTRGCSTRPRAERRTSRPRPGSQGRRSRSKSRISTSNCPSTVSGSGSGSSPAAAAAARRSWIVFIGTTSTK